MTNFPSFCNCHQCGEKIIITSSRLPPSTSRKYARKPFYRRPHNRIDTPAAAGSISSEIMELSREDERPDILMSAKDKDGINKFSRHLARRNELKSRIERRKKLLQLHDDAADELILMDDDAAVHYTVGDVFIVDDKEHIEETLEKTKAELSKDIEEYEDEQKTLHEEMTALKASLYAKFGKTINLEE